MIAGQVSADAIRRDRWQYLNASHYLAIGTASPSTEALRLAIANVRRSLATYRRVLREHEQALTLAAALRDAGDVTITRSST